MRRSVRFVSTRTAVRTLLLGTSILGFGLENASAAAPNYIEGTLNVAVEDYAGTKAEEVYELTDSTGKTSDLLIQGKRRTGLRTGQRVRLKGARRKKTDIILPATGTITVTPQGQLAAISSIKTMAVVRISSLDSIPSCSAATLANVYFNGAQSVRGFYETNSFGAFSFKTDADGNNQPDIFEVSVNRATQGVCNIDTFASEATAALAAQGINLNNWNVKVFVLPSNVACGWAGRGELSNGTGRVWIPGSMCGVMDVAAHEVGHVQGLHHATTDSNNDGTYEDEYGDRSCIMGYSGVGWRHFNVLHNAQEGWLPANKRATPNSNGEYKLSALELDPAANEYPYVLTFPRPLGGSYYVSYREAIGQYSAGLTSNFNGRVAIHHGGATPGYSYLVRSLAPGQSYTDPTGITLTATTAGGGAATVNLTFPCIRAAPGIWATTDMLTTSPGTSRQFTINLYNDDSIGCDARAFDLSCSSQSGTSCSFDSPTSPVIARQTYTQVTLTVSANSNVGEGIYYATATAGGEGGSSSEDVRLRIDGVVPTTPADVKFRVTKKGYVRIRWKRSKDANGIAAYHVYRNGELISTSPRSNFVDKTAPRDATYTYWVDALDRGGNLSAESLPIIVTIPPPPPPR